MIVLLLIYMRGLGVEFKLDFRESAYPCFCTFSETEVNFQMSYGGYCANASSPLLSSDATLRPLTFPVGATSHMWLLSKWNGAVWIEVDCQYQVPWDFKDLVKKET